MNKAESHDQDNQMENYLMIQPALLKQYSADVNRKFKNRTIEDRGAGGFKITSNNIIIAVRVRSLSMKEIENEEFEVIRVMDRKLVVLMDPLELTNSKATLGKNRSKEKQYAFDYAFDSYTGQNEIFENTTKSLVNGILSGQNASVFAYGSTGAGKTYTMLGTEANPGNMFLTIKELFVKINGLSNNYNYDIRVSFLEIYNEMIRDLFVVSEDALELREDKNKGICVAGLSEVEVGSLDDLMELLIFGNQNRAREATGVNETSSRSNAILQVFVEAKDKTSGVTSVGAVGKLSFIDMAGAEVVAKTDSESKLTRLLKDSLGGNSRTVMIANISPGNVSYKDTYNTLKYASSTKNIKTSIKKNVHNADYHVSKYTQVINQLKNEVSSLRQQLENRSDMPDNLRSTMEMGVSLVENIEVYQNELANHFDEETQTKRRIDELEQKAELCKLSIANVRGSITQSVRHNGRAHYLTQELSKELENLYKNEKNFKAQ